MNWEIVEISALISIPVVQISFYTAANDLYHLSVTQYLLRFLSLFHQPPEPLLPFESFQAKGLNYVYKFGNTTNLNYFIES